MNFSYVESIFSFMMHVHSKPDLSKYSVLIVDDAPVNLGVLVAFLEQCGLGIRVARSGKRALERVQYELPDIILLDVLMPGIDGFETCRLLKENPATADVPIIFMTSLTGAEDKVRGFEAGAVDYVTKPLHQEEVLARITTHLQLRELTQTLRQQNRSLQVTSAQEKARLLSAVQEQRKQLRHLNTRLNEVKEAEHKQLARELHDELGQTLTAIQINLAALRQELNGNLSSFGHERFAETEQLTNQTLNRVRELSLDLRPSMLDDLGLIPTVRWYVKRYGKRLGIQAELHIDGTIPRLSAGSETNLYRIIQEALTNIAKHAEATYVAVTFKAKDDHLCVIVQDNGRGFLENDTAEPSFESQGVGLLGMRERALLLDGRMEIDTSPQSGTKITVIIPKSTS